jgi:SAM-dependent methyltransferase
MCTVHPLRMVTTSSLQTRPSASGIAIDWLRFFRLGSITLQRLGLATLVVERDDLASRGYRVLAIDLSESMLLQLIGKLPQSDQGSSTNPSSEDDPRILPLRMNLVDMAGLADQSLDHGVCLFATMGMIQGRQHRRAFLSHVTRLLRPGGQFVVHVHHRWAGLTEPGGWRRLLTSLIRRDQEIGDSVYAYRGIGDMFMHRYGRRELIADLKLSGFKQVTVDRINRTGDGLASRFSLAGGFMAVASV